MIIVGIDPGVTGAIAMIGHRAEFIHCVDLPVMVRTESRVRGKGGEMRTKTTNQVNATALAAILREWLKDYDREAVHVMIEKCQAMPGMIKGNPKAQSSAGTFSLGLSAGVIEGVVGALGVPHTLVHPATWKASIKLAGGTKKDVYRTYAQRLFPAAPLARMKDHNRAEALLIAKFGHGLLS